LTVEYNDNKLMFNIKFPE